MPSFQGLWSDTTVYSGYLTTVSWVAYLKRTVSPCSCEADVCRPPQERTIHAPKISLTYNLNVIDTNVGRSGQTPVVLLGTVEVEAQALNNA